MVFGNQPTQSKLPAPGTFVVALLLILPQSGQGVESPCTYNGGLTIANCSGRGLSFVPWGLHKSILKLDLSNNNFPTIANQSFISYQYIKELYLRNNSVQSIEARAFQTLNFLSTLDLSNNKLYHIPSSSLEPVASSLKQLILSGNKIQSIPKWIFQQFTKLEHLDLSGNSVIKIDYGAFKGLVSMKEFKIRHNALKSLPFDAFNDFPQTIRKVQLYDNRWVCDCEMRWLRQWLNQTDPSVWDSPGYSIRCDGPSIVREKPLNILPLDELACEVQMKTSSSSRELGKGANTTLLCKYTSVPEADAKWLRNSEIIDVSKHSKKYSVESWTIEGYHGERTQMSELKIKNFKYEDIAKYECFVQNIRGVATTEYKLTLEGVAFDSVSPAPPEGQMASSGMDKRSLVIAVAVVCGIILIIVIGVLIFCTVNRMQRLKQAQRDAIVENVKQHFINNSEATLSNGDINGLNDTKMSSKSMEEKLDRTNEDDRSTSNNTNDSNMTAVKRPLDLDETEPLYIFEQPGSPFNNGNTYVSFGSELTDPGDFPTPNPVQYPRHSSSRYESSHAGSATPLLDRYTPSVFDSDEPVEDYAQYPVYDSLTNSIQHPHGEGIYSAPNRNGSTSGYSSYRSQDGAKRLSSFHYPPSVNGSMPRTPGSTRSTLALAPRYADFSDGSPRPDLHRNPSSDYRDYREMRYPGTTPPPHRMTPATKKSMSVGNLGYAPLSTGPRKPPRLFQSREYMELTPQESPGDYITSPEAQQYSQSYGITPGTPV